MIYAQMRWLVYAFADTCTQTHTHTVRFEVKMQKRLICILHMSLHTPSDLIDEHITYGVLLFRTFPWRPRSPQLLN